MHTQEYLHIRARKYYSSMIKLYLENWCLGSEGLNHLSHKVDDTSSSPGTHKNQDEWLIFGILACLEEDGMETQKNSLVIRGQASLG